MIGLTERLRQLEVNKQSLEELVEMLVGARLLRNEYTQLQVPIPSHIDQGYSVLLNSISSRLADMKAKRLREAKTELEALTPASERRERLAKEIEALENSLGMAKATA